MASRSGATTPRASRTPRSAVSPRGRSISKRTEIISTPRGRSISKRTEVISSPRGRSISKTFSSEATSVVIEKDSNKRPNVDVAAETIPIIVKKIEEGKATPADLKQAVLILQLADAEITKDEMLLKETEDHLDDQQTRIRQKRNEKARVTTKSALSRSLSIAESDAFKRLKQEKEEWKEKAHLKQAKVVELEAALKDLNREKKELVSTNKSLRKGGGSKKSSGGGPKPLSKAELRKIKELRDLEVKMEKQKLQMKDARADLKRERQNLKKDRDNLVKDRNGHAHELHEFHSNQKKIKSEFEKIDHEKHKLKLEKAAVEHEHILLDQKNMKMSHAADVHRGQNADIHKLRSTLYETESKLKWALARLKWQGSQTTKIIERMKYVPNWIESEGWDRSKTDKYITEFVKQVKEDDHKNEAKVKQDEAHDRVELEPGEFKEGDTLAELTEQRKLNTLLHDEVERTHKEFTSFRSGLNKNLHTLTKNEDILVENAKKILDRYEGASIHALLEKTPNMKPKKVVAISNREITKVISDVQHKIDDAHQHENEVHGDEENILENVSLKDSVKITMSELLVKIGRLLLQMNKQAMARQVGEGTISDPTAGMTIAAADEGEYAIKYTRLQKKYEALRVVQSEQKDIIALLKKQLEEAYQRHAQIHTELEAVLKIFLKAQLAAEGDGGPGFMTRIDIKEEYTKEQSFTRAAVADALGVKTSNVEVHNHANILGTTDVGKLFVGGSIMPAGTVVTGEVSEVVQTTRGAGVPETINETVETTTNVETTSYRTVTVTETIETY